MSQRGPYEEPGRQNQWSNARKTDKWNGGITNYNQKEIEMHPLAQLTNRIIPLVAPYITPVFGRQPETGQEYTIGTATCIKYKNRLFIVTAGHVAARLIDGYELGVFAKDSKVVGRLHTDWWASPDALWGDKEWGDDIAILDITDYPTIDLMALPATFLTRTPTLQENQGIFLSGYAINPRSANNHIEIPLLQKSDVEAMKFTIRTFTSSAAYQPDVPVERSSQFCVYFSSEDNLDLQGNDLNYLFSAKGLSGSAVWRVRNSPPSDVNVTLNGLEIIGIARSWSKETKTILVTKADEVFTVLDAYMNSHEGISASSEGTGHHNGDIF
jgi:hypothetical protein